MFNEIRETMSPECEFEFITLGIFDPWSVEDCPKTQKLNFKEEMKAKDMKLREIKVKQANNYDVDLKQKVRISGRNKMVFIHFGWYKCLNKHHGICVPNTVVERRVAA